MVFKVTFPLQFHLPVVDNTTFVSSWPGFATFKYRFIEHAHQQEVIGFPEVLRTKILMEYFPEMLDEKVRGDLSAAFMNCLIFLNNFIDAYRLTSNMEDVKNFSIPDLPPYLLFDINGDKAVYVLPHFKLTMFKREVSAGLVSSALTKLTVWRLYRSFETIDRFLSKAINHLYNEEFVFAIVELQTSFESYIRLCQQLILKKDGATDEEVERRLDMPLKNTIEHYLSKRLNENLTVKTNKVMTRWNTSLYGLRNQIVHSGLSYISGNEAYEAYDAYQETINYLSDILVREELIDDDKIIKIDNLKKNVVENYDADEAIQQLKDRGIGTFLDDY